MQHFVNIGGIEQRKRVFRVYSNVGGGLPLPTIVRTPGLVASSTVKKIVAGPGG